MSKMTRIDKRKPEETRPMSAEAGVIKRADGSAVFRIGETIAYATVYGPRDLYPRFLQDPSKGILRVSYNMMPFSGSGDRVRPGGNRRSKEISMVTKKALEPVIDLGDFPNAVVDVFIELPQTDAGTRCAGICAASMALADAGIIMKDMVTAVSVGRVGKDVVVDLSYAEEDYDCPEGVADIPIAVLPRTGELTLLQCDGRLKREDLKKAIELSKDAVAKINDIQKKALKEKFKGESQ
ncbi:exosome complex exonuclease Rrp41 [Candidatus Woesearchaeota archaeon]|nr:exosome complex exonuclease Rrp41 [Candidatus Woesearchaeota archaeon]